MRQTANPYDAEEVWRPWLRRVDRGREAVPLDAEPRVLYLADGDGEGWDPPFRQAKVRRRVGLANGGRGWLVDIEPPIPPAGSVTQAVGAAVLADRYVGTSLDALVDRGVGIAPQYPIVPVYVCTAVPPATLEQDSFADGELTIDFWADAALREDAFPGPKHRTVPGRERLSSALVKLEDALRLARAPIVDYLAPGIPADAVRERLGEIDIDPCPELLTWYDWHDGTVGNIGLGYETWELQPGVFFISLEQALEQHRLIQQQLADLARLGMDPADSYPAGAFPITRHLGPYHDVVSCETDRGGTTWFVSGDGPPEPNGPHLADLVERLWRRWWHGAYRWDGQRWVFGAKELLGIGPDVPW